MLRCFTCANLSIRNFDFDLVFLPVCGSCLLMNSVHHGDFSFFDTRLQSVVPGHVGRDVIDPWGWEATAEESWGVIELMDIFHVI